jgi:hypothetical protein
MIKTIKKIYDSKTKIISSRSDIDFSRFVNKIPSEFSDLEKQELKHFLESKSKEGINITEATFIFYLNKYLIQSGYKVNLSKLKHIISDYNEENNGFEIKKIVPFFQMVIQEYKNVVK